jgi:hypothetical protein
VRILLISTYELGHQPLHVASPAARLRAAGHDVRALDLGVQDWDDDLAAWAEAVAISVPMHTAMRLGVDAARRVRERHPDAPLCFYGLYAPVGRDLTDGLGARVIAGEYEQALVEWAGGVTAKPGQVVELARGREQFALPARDLLPPLDRYAHLEWNGERRVAGYVEATHGCAHRCRHCPVPTVYDGQFRVVAVETVLEDVRRLVAGGARHVTFGDPDFLNGPGHALSVVRAVHDAFPELTWDATVKVEHVLRHADLWHEFAAAGLLFVVSAFESTDDAQLAILDKGHTAADMAAAVTLLRTYGVEIRPSWMPFTPWASAGHIADVLDFTLAHDLVANTDPVQFSIRLLVPDGSLLLGHPAMSPHTGAYDPERLSWSWHSPDPAVDALQQRLAAIAEAGVDEDTATVFLRMAAEVDPAAGRALPDEAAVRAAAHADRPRLSEPWFCCAEPTQAQQLAVVAPAGAAAPRRD